MKKIFIALMGLSGILVSCGPEEVDPEFETELTEITSYMESGYTITLFAVEELFVGYNVITAKVEDATSKLVNSAVTITPMMDMMTMSHSCPFEYKSGMEIVDGKIEFASIFVMPSGDMGSWTLDFDIEGTVIKVPITVAQPELSRLKSFVSVLDDSKRYFVTMISPANPQVGQNDFEIGVFIRQSMMSWPPVDYMNIELEPWMTSMDHGSPNNVAPTLIEKGHYQGKVNFTMTGDWEIRLKLMEGDQTHGEITFDILF